jgi:hypothetical protein
MKVFSLVKANWGIRYLVYVLVGILCTSCTVDCDLIEKDLKTKYCNIIVKDLPGAGRHFRIVGINPTTGAREVYSDGSSWYIDFNDDISVGDTVVKRQDELKFYIHKKDTVLVFPYTCGGYGTNRRIN